MKIVENGDKVNFVDGNNVFVGYDIGQSCCENADWFIDDKQSKYEYDWREPKSEPKKFDTEGYSFDTKFFETRNDGDLDSGEMAIFKLTSNGKPDLYLHIFNAHNGYYGHRFEAKIGGLDWQSGCL